MNPSQLAHSYLARLALAAPLLLAACGTGVAAEPNVQGRVALVPTFTALPAPTATHTPLPEPSPEAAYATATPDQFAAAGLPVRLRIPAVHIDAAIEHVGLTNDGFMDVPKIADNVAWYRFGPLPGQQGNAVINGHLDQAASRAVFYDLRMVIPGDEMVVTYANGDEYVFVIDEKARYSHDQSPMGLITGPSTERRLNLITCDGAWDRGSTNYSQRLVVYSSLKAGGIEARGPDLDALDDS
jgi:sortase (surface protein transpeptidase)